jgi:hypothetical protein
MPYLYEKTKTFTKTWWSIEEILEKAGLSGEVKIFNGQEDEIIFPFNLIFEIKENVDG